MGFDEVRAIVQRIIGGRILVGHSIQNDLDVSLSFEMILPFDADLHFL